MTEAAPQQSYLGSLYAWGGSMVQYASEQVSRSVHIGAIQQV